jgi:hypothetical protein
MVHDLRELLRQAELVERGRIRARDAERALDAAGSATDVRAQASSRRCRDREVDIADIGEPRRLRRIEERQQ